MSGATWTCPEHGVTYGDVQGSRSITWSCPNCESIAKQQERWLEHQHRCYRWWQEGAGIPSRYRGATPASIQPATSSAKALARAVAAYAGDLQARLDAGAGLLMIGPPGLGKTLGLVATINAACQRYHGPIYASWPDSLAELKAGIGGARDDQRRQAVERLRDAPFLALDELGVRGMSDFDHSELFGLIDHRYREELPTLVAANATPANFATLVGERVADRLRETCATIVVTGDSLRGKCSISGPDALQPPENKLMVRVHAQGQWRERSFEPPDGRFRA